MASGYNKQSLLTHLPLLRLEVPFVIFTAPILRIEDDSRGDAIDGDDC